MLITIKGVAFRFHFVAAYQKMVKILCELPKWKIKKNTQINFVKTKNLCIVIFDLCFQSLIKRSDQCFFSRNLANFSEIACSFSVSYYQNYPKVKF